MAQDVFLAGNRFNLYRLATGAAVFVCAAVSLGLTRTNTYDDATAPNCDDPTAVPWQKSTKKMRSWAASFSGKAAAAHLDILRADVDSEAAVAYEFRVVPIDGIGSGSYLGSIHFENLQIQKQENGIVSFSVSARGDGALEWNDL